MADNNWNQRRSHHEDWDEQQNQTNQGSRIQGGYGGDDYARYWTNQGDYNRITYLPHNDQYRKDNYGYAGNQYGDPYNRQHEEDRFRNSQYGNKGQHLESIYGGDTRNYGNANQGGIDRDWWDRTREKVSSWFGGDSHRDRDRNEGTTGTHRGKGPKDYRRSEERIREDVYDRLTDDDHIDASHIQVQVQGDEVVLSGTVHHREEKWRAEDVVESVRGVRTVDNRIKVDRGNNR